MVQARGLVKLGSPQPRPLKGLWYTQLHVLHYEPRRSSVTRHRDHSVDLYASGEGVLPCMIDTIHRPESQKQ